MIPEGSILIESIDISSFFLMVSHEVTPELYPCLLREDPDRFAKIDLLHLHEKSDRPPSLSTGETVTDILTRRYDEGGGLLTMKWAESLIVHSCFFRLHISVHDIEDIDARFYILGERHILFIT